MGVNDSMQMKTFIVGPIDVNCYVLQDEASHNGMIIDPGGSAKEILEYVKSAGIAVQYIVNTHGHGDHIGADDALREATGAKLLIHAADAPMLAEPRRNLSAYMGFSAQAAPADGFLADGQEIRLGKLYFRALHTPGHSPGGICLLGEGVLFSGDSLFAGSVGRCDFPGASESDLLQALRDKILPLPDEVKVYPGHGPATTIGSERLHNPYLQA